MLNIFTKEEEVVLQAEKVLSGGQFKSGEDEECYRFLLEEYKTLLKQMMRMVKMSDMMQLELKNLSSKLEVASQIDVLTGLYNRRFFNDAYQKEFRNALRAQTSMALIMIDIDYFKKYNDNYGHLQGDECLAAIAREIQQVVRRPRDIAARFGGEEFVVMMPETNSNGAVFITRELLTNITNLALEHASSPIDKIVTVSIGVAALVPDDNLTMDSFLIRTDNALYAAKKAGRNCFRLYDSQA